MEVGKEQETMVKDSKCLSKHSPNLRVELTSVVTMSTDELGQLLTLTKLHSSYNHCFNGDIFIKRFKTHGKKLDFYKYHK